jgi:hypothetical protein
MHIYIVKDDYTTDYPTIYGAYTTQEIAEEVVSILSNPDHPKNPYGENLNENDTLDIDRITVYDKVTI